jgi:predicted secreted hydrolase
VRSSGALAWARAAGYAPGRVAWGVSRVVRRWRRAGCGAVLAMAVTMLSVPAAWAGGPIPDVGTLGGGVRVGEFAQVLGPREFEFPRDHGPHPEYRQEWWYVTGNLDSAMGERFGFELTFFRFALAPEVTGPAAGVVRTAAESAWRTNQFYMAHFAITDVAHKQFRFEQKLSRGAVGLAGSQNPPLNVWIDDWSLRAAGPGDTGAAAAVTSPAGGRWSLHAVESGYELTLDAEALQQIVLNGERGFSRKSSDPGSASYYYSIPRVSVRGRLVRDGKPLDVQGLAWVDREWGSGALGHNEQGWDWFALQLQDGSSLMFYALRNHDGRRDPHSAGTWIAASGQSQPLASDEVQIEVLDYWRNPRGERYPAHWRVRVPARGVDLDVRPILSNQELTASARYWEGAVDVTGANGDPRTVGRGYVELVGYAAAQ